MKVIFSNSKKEQHLIVPTKTKTFMQNGDGVPFKIQQECQADLTDGQCD